MIIALKLIFWQKMSHLSRSKRTFSQYLDNHITESGYSVSQVARLSGLSKRTLANWVSGYVKKPRHADDLMRICHTLHLSPQATQHLFELAGLSAPESLISEKPFHIGPDLPYFVGRDDKLAQIESDLLNGTLKFAYAIVGMAGVGKTTFAWHVAHQLANHFPDGVLWAQVDSIQAVETVLTSFALSFGVDVTTLPDRDSKSRQWRTLLRGKKTLIILDNVSQFSDVEPLIPARGDSLVLITTRQQGFGTLQGLEQIVLNPFGNEAWSLIAHFLPAERIRADKDELQALITQLGGLPLALSIAMSRLAAEPHWTVAQLIQQLTSLNKIAIDDVSLQSVFQMTYQRLPELSQIVFGVLGLFNREQISLEAVAAVLDMSQSDTQAELAILFRASILQMGQAQLYRLHPLVAQFSRSMPPAKTLQLRFVNYYVYYIEENYHDYEAITQHVEHILAMFDIALVHHAVEPIVTGISYFFRYLEDRDLLVRIEHLMDQFYQLLQSINDPESLAKIAYYCGRLQRRLGDTQSGREFTEEALKLGIQTDQERVILLCHNSLGIHAMTAGNYDEALRYFKEAYAIIYEYELFGYRYSNFVNTANVYYQLGRFDEARATASQVLEFVTDINSEPDSIQITVGYVYALLRMISSSTGQQDDALYYQKLGLSLAKKLNDQKLLEEFTFRS